MHNSRGNEVLRERFVHLYRFTKVLWYQHKGLIPTVSPIVHPDSVCLSSRRKQRAVNFPVARLSTVVADVLHCGFGWLRLACLKCTRGANLGPRTLDFSLPQPSCQPVWVKEGQQWNSLTLCYYQAHNSRRHCQLGAVEACSYRLTSLSYFSVSARFLRRHSACLPCQ